MISFKTNGVDKGLIKAIVARAVADGLAEAENSINVSMSITACHCNGCPLKLQELLNADGFNFAHDLFGIDRNVSHTTGKLKNHFLPRYAKPGSAVEIGTAIHKAILEGEAA